MLTDMPQLSGFTKNGHVVGIPYDASFTVTTVNKTMFAKAGIAKLPTTIAQYTKDLQTIKAKGIAQHKKRKSIISINYALLYNGFYYIH